MSSRSYPQNLKSLSVLLSLLTVFAFGFTLLYANIAQSQELVSKFDIGEIEFSLQQSDSESFSVELHPKGGVSSLSTDFTATVFAITGPSRLVIDIPGITFGVDKKQAVSNEIIERVRVGSHPNKTRFVIDIKIEATPNYQVKTDVDKEAIVVSFNFSPAEVSAAKSKGVEKSKISAKTTPPPAPVITEPTFPDPEPQLDVITSGSQLDKQVNNDVQENSPEPTPDPVKDADALLIEAIKAAQDQGPAPAQDNTSSPDDPVVATDLDTVEPQQDTLASITPEPTPNPEPSNTGGATVVTAIEFKTWPANDTSAVVFSTRNAGNYKLFPQGDKRFELRLPNAKLGGNHLVLPQFPPEEFKEFDVIMARQDKEGVVIRIFVTKGVKLYPAKIDGRIWLKTSE